MKKNTILFNLLAVILCATAAPAAAADFCGQTCTDCCEWSVLDGKMTVGADWLYWNVQQDGISPGTISVIDSTATPPLTSRSNVYPKSKWNNGFRVNLGYELPCQCWDVNLSYSYIPTKATITDFVAANENESFAVFGGPLFDAFRSKWNMNLQNVDLDIGRVVSFGECLSIKPHVGFRATWFNQKFHAVGFTVEDETPLFSYTTISEKFQGYGVEAGLWTDYKLGCGVSLVGHFGGSILYSKFKVNTTNHLGAVIETELTPVAALVSSNSFCTATPSLDYFVGIQYADTMCDMLFKIHAGWEQHVLFDTNRYLSSGNLTTQGLTLGLEAGF